MEERICQERQISYGPSRPWSGTASSVPNEFLNKLDLVGKDLTEYSRETVRAFFRDAAAAAYRIEPTRVAAE
jgi:hypothetical protein